MVSTRSACVLFLALTSFASAFAQVIESISVCSPGGAGGQGSCPPGMFDTQQIVLAPDGSGRSINQYADGGISDEHASVFPPGSLNGNPDYLFFVATRTKVNSDTGLLALSGGHGPNTSGQWTMDFASADGYDTYPAGLARIFLSPVGRGCPTVLDGVAAHQDQTFDLNYAAPGSIVIDPTNRPGNLLMIYEGTITCFGVTNGPRSQNFYSTTGIATSTDYGRAWPTYRGSANFNFVSLPSQNTTQGPQSLMGALGSATCMGADCTTTLPATYGRYAVLTPSVSVATAMASGKPLEGSMGDSEISGFVDDAAAGPAQFVYIVYDYGPGNGALLDPLAAKNDLMIARAQLNGGTAPLRFFKWNGNAFSSPGIGGLDTAVFPTGSFEACEAAGQGRFGPSLSYVDETHQYLLTFVCDSPGDPALNGSGPSTRGAAWFYATNYDLSDPRKWSTPREVSGSWSTFDTSGGCSDYKGWYPTFLSPARKNGHLGPNGFVFYLWGCQTGNTPEPPGRQYSTRAFTMTIAPSRRRAARHQ